MSHIFITDKPEKPLLPDKPNTPILPKKLNKPLLPTAIPAKPLIKGVCLRSMVQNRKYNLYKKAGT